MKHLKHLSGVTTFDRKADKISRIVEAYQSPEELRCSCGERKTHKEGFHVQFKSGEEGLLGGSTCGPKYFGVEWERAWQAKEKEDRHARNVKRLVPTRNRAREMQRVLKTLEPYAKHKDAVFLTVKQKLPRFYDQLERAALKHNGNLLLGSNASRSDDDSPANDDHNEYFTIRGHHCIGLNFRNRMADVFRSLDGVLAEIECDDVDDETFESAEKRLQDLSMDFLPMLQEGKAFEVFFERSHLAQLFAACEKAGLLGNVRYRNGKLHISTRGYGRNDHAQEIAIDYEASFVGAARL